MPGKSRYLTCVTLLSLWLLHSCASPPSAPVDPAGGETVGQTSGAIFRHRWWNYYERGLSFAEGRYFDDALKDLEEAIAQRERDQRMARTYGMHFIDYFPNRELGIIYYEMGVLETAKTFLLRSIEQYPSAKAYFYLDHVRRELIRASGEFVTPPTIHLEGMDTVLWTRADPVTLQGSASDPFFIEALNINGRPLFMESARQEFTFSTALRLPQGSHPITVEAVNLGGATAARTIVVNIDRQGPVVAVAQIRPIRGANGIAVELSGMLSDFSGVASVKINAESLRVAPGRRVPFRHRLPEGINTLHIDAVDRLGNHTAADIDMEELTARPAAPLLAASELSDLGGLLGPRDRTPPKIDLNDFSDAQTVFMDKVYLDGVVTDQGGITEVAVNGEPIESSSGRIVFFNHVAPLNVGANTILVTANDKAGNRTEKSIDIFRRVPEAFQLDARLKVSVYPFERLVSGGDQGVVFQEHLIGALLEQNRFRVVERSHLELILREQRLNTSALVDSGTAIKVGRLVAAQSIIAGSIIESRQGVEVISRMIDTETSDILATIDVYGEVKDRNGFSDLAEGMALKYHREFPLSNGIVINASGDTIFTDLGQEEIKLQRRVIVYREAMVRHPLDDRVLGTDKQILCRARVTQVQAKMSKARLIDDPKLTVEKLHKVVAE